MSALDNEINDEELPSDSEDEEEVAAAGEKEEEVDMSLGNPDVTTKYQTAAKIVNAALSFVASQCVAGAKIIDICKSGEEVMKGQLASVYGKKVKGKAVEKGISFPVCVSVNEVVSNNSPLASEPQAPLAVGDIVKIDMGCHIDGYVAVSGHTLICGESADAVPATVDPQTCDVATAAYNAMLVAVSKLVVGGKNQDITEAVAKVAADYNVVPLFKIRMNSMTRFVIEGTKEIALRDPDVEDEEEEKCKSCEFEANEVYAIDIAMSTGDGRVKEGDERTTIYKRDVDVNYKLRMKSARNLLNDVKQGFPTMPFSIRMMEDEKTAKMGVTECVSHKLLVPYPVLREREGEKVARFQTTVLLLPSGPKAVTGLPMPEYFKSDKECDDAKAVMAALAEAEAKKAAKKKKKKAKK